MIIKNGYIHLNYQVCADIPEDYQPLLQYVVTGWYWVLLYPL